MVNITAVLFQLEYECLLLGVPFDLLFISLSAGLKCYYITLSDIIYLNFAFLFISVDPEPEAGVAVNLSGPFCGPSEI